MIGDAKVADIENLASKPNSKPTSKPDEEIVEQPVITPAVVPSPPVIAAPPIAVPENPMDFQKIMTEMFGGAPGPVGAPGGPVVGAVFDVQERRKMIREIKDEIKPMIGQVCDYQIEKSSSMLKTMIKKLDIDLISGLKKMKKKLDKDIKDTKEEAVCLVDDLETRLYEEIAMINKNMARAKSDSEVQYRKLVMSQ